MHEWCLQIYCLGGLELSPQAAVEVSGLIAFAGTVLG